MKIIFSVLPLLNNFKKFKEKKKAIIKKLYRSSLTTLKKMYKLYNLNTIYI